MPENKGRMPRYELVDIKFRNGVVKRGVDPKKWRWASWGWESDWDIVHWQRNVNDRTPDVDSDADKRQRG